MDKITPLSKNSKVAWFGQKTENWAKSESRKARKKRTQILSKRWWLDPPRARSDALKRLVFEELFSQKSILRVALFPKLTCWKSPDKLLALRTGFRCETKQVFAGISQPYKPEDLVGKMTGYGSHFSSLEKCVFVCQRNGFWVQDQVAVICLILEPHDVRAWYDKFKWRKRIKVNWRRPANAGLFFAKMRPTLGS